MNKIKNIYQWLIRYLDSIISIIIVGVVSILGILGDVPDGIVTSTILLVLGLISYSMIRDREEVNRIKDTLQEFRDVNIITLLKDGLLSDRTTTGIDRILPNFMNYNWLHEIKGVRNITIAKMKLNFTENPTYFEELEKVLLGGGKITLVVSDPRSPAIWLRYHEEADRTIPEEDLSETMWIGGVQDLAISLHRLYLWKERLIKKDINTTNLSIKVNPNYPTQAIYKFDDRLYLFGYPFHERGFHSPVFLFTNPNTSVYHFLNRCINEIVKYSEPIDDVFPDIWKRYNNGEFTESKVCQAKIVIDQPNAV